MDLTNIREIKRLLDKHGTGTKKRFGQNFLISPSVPVKIARESLGLSGNSKDVSNAGVIEIGAGIGALSWELCKIYKKTVAVELDRTLEPVLNEVFENTANFKVVFADILKTDLKNIAESEFSDCEKINICANLPYYITTPVIIHLLESGVKFNTITVMMQKEVADRLCAVPGSENYGSITLFVNYHGKVKKLFAVPPSNFYPAPKVTSCVVQIIPHEIPEILPKDEQTLFKVIRASFEQRRKTLVNALSSAFNSDKFNKPLISDIVQRITGDINIRGEMLTLKMFCAISDEIYSSNLR